MRSPCRKGVHHIRRRWWGRVVWKLELSYSEFSGFWNYASVYSTRQCVNWSTTYLWMSYTALAYCWHIGWWQQSRICCCRRRRLWATSMQDVHPCIGAVTSTCARSTYLIRYSSLSIAVSYLFIRRSVEQLKGTSKGHLIQHKIFWSLPGAYLTCTKFGI
jgi:hypothetical protein